MCGACPIPVGLDKTNARHRLNRGGIREANAALHRAVMVRMRWHQLTIDYFTRTAEGRVGGQPLQDRVRPPRRLVPIPR